RPGTVAVTGLRRLHEVILDAGGITARGSLRRVLVTRKSGVTEWDPLSFELGGDLTQNPSAEEGMRIHVPARGPSVTLTGAVRRPGEYEVGPSGSLRALLELVGGLSQASAGSDARLTRVGWDGRKETTPIVLQTELAPVSDVACEVGDVIVEHPV